MANDAQRGRCSEKETHEPTDVQGQADSLASLPKETQELLDKFPDKAKRKIIAQFASYSGPIAHPTLVKEYEAILPGAANASSPWPGPKAIIADSKKPRSLIVKSNAKPRVFSSVF